MAASEVDPESWRLGSVALEAAFEQWCGLMPQLNAWARSRDFDEDSGNAQLAALLLSRVVVGFFREAMRQHADPVLLLDAMARAERGWDGRSGDKQARELSACLPFTVAAHLDRIAILRNMIAVDGDPTGTLAPFLERCLDGDGLPSVLEGVKRAEWEKHSRDWKPIDQWFSHGGRRDAPWGTVFLLMSEARPKLTNATSADNMRDSMRRASGHFAIGRRKAEPK